MGHGLRAGLLAGEAQAMDDVIRPEDAHVETY
jgi:hypothetical protein